jgi:4a-hydroxytetrahydrobiopterin dehydratase
MALSDEIIQAGDLEARLAPLCGWHGDTSGICRDYRIGYDDAIRAVAEIGRAAAELEHRPDIDIRWDRLTVYLTTHTAGDVVTELDLVTASRIDEIAKNHGASLVAGE